MSIDKQKKEIRINIRDKKRLFSLNEKKEKSKSIFKQLEDLDHFKKSKTIMVYWSMNDEVYTHDFILKYYQTKKIILPKVVGNDLELKQFTGIENMVLGDYGIAEPSGETFSELSALDIIIVPGVAFDRNLNRLGRGKAYYDKLLKNTKAIKVGICFDFQLIDKVPVDEHDIKMEMVISD